MYFAAAHPPLVPYALLAGTLIATACDDGEARVPDSADAAIADGSAMSEPRADAGWDGGTVAEGGSADPDPECEPNVEYESQVCLAGRVRDRCDGGSCASGEQCCWGVCIPDGFDQAFCETCPVSDASLCEPSEDCAELPFDFDPLRRGGALWAGVLEHLSCGSPWNPCQPEPGRPPEDVCWLEEEIGPSIGRERFLLTCNESGRLLSSKATDASLGGVLSLDTYERDACGNAVMAVRSHRRFRAGSMSAEPLWVSLSRFEEGLVTTCGAFFSSGHWQGEACARVARLDDGTWHASGYPDPSESDPGTARDFADHRPPLWEHRYELDEQGSVTAYWDGDGQGYVVSYDSAGRVVETMSHDGSVKKIVEYDDDNHTTTVSTVDDIGATVSNHDISFTEDGRPVEGVYVYGDAAPVLDDWQYDAQGRLLECRRDFYGDEQWYFRYSYDDCEPQ